MARANLDYANLANAKLTNVNFNQTSMSNSNNTRATWTGVTYPPGAPAAVNPLTCEHTQTNTTEPR